METWTSVLLAITGNAVVLAVLGYLARSVLEKFLLRETKQFEADLKAKADATMERLKSDLQLRTIEHQVRFSKLHEKRAVVIAELYSKLCTALWDSESFLSPMQFGGEPDQKLKHVAAMNSLVDAYRYFGEHRIYLPHEMGVSLEKVISDTRVEVIRLGVWMNSDDDLLPSHAQKTKQETWMAAWETVKKDIPLAMQALDEEFRVLLGSSQKGSLTNE